jgi:hypothetical protein
MKRRGGLLVPPPAAALAALPAASLSAVLIAALLCACVQPELPEDPYRDLESEMFYAYDYRISKRYSLEAVKLAERPGSAVVYGERSLRVSLETAETIAGEFADHILPLISSIFGQALDYNNDGMVTLLLLDIKDGAAANGAYTAGYFASFDMNDASDSNKRDMLYLDVVQGGPQREDFFATISHELQHLIRYSAYLEGGGTAYPDTWIDEGLSLAAEYVYWSNRKKTPVLGDYYVDSFNGKDRESRIPRGNNFFVWINNEYVLDEYATAFLFFQWLRIQADKDIEIYRDIIASINKGTGDYRAVLDAAQKRIDSGLDSWEALIRAWLLANYVRAPDKNDEKNGLYGYNREFPDLQTTAIGESGLSLYPGEGAYSNLRSGQKFTPTQESGPHIRYVGVAEDGTISGTSPYGGTRLLTFNSNSNSNRFALDKPYPAMEEQGWLSGLGDSPDSGRGSRRSASHLPYRIDVPPALPPAAPLDGQ